MSRYAHLTTTEGDQVASAAELVAEDLPTSWVDQHLTEVAGATPSIVDAALEELGLDKLTLALAGDAKRICQAVEDLTGTTPEVVER